MQYNNIRCCGREVFAIISAQRNGPDPTWLDADQKRHNTGVDSSLRVLATAVNK
jgi:hypothetical protein